MKKTFVVVNYSQFGYHTDSLKYCQHMPNFQIDYFCVNAGLKRITLPNVTVHYSPFIINKKITTLLFILYVVIWNFFQKKWMFVVYFPYCFLIKKMLNRKNIHLDIRTLSVSPSEDIRADYNNKVKKAMKYFESISVISDGVADELGLKRYYLLPLGADRLSSQETVFDAIRLLYVGTFFNRNIEQTVYGLKLFVDKHPEIKNIHYDIIGFGNGEKEIVQMIEKCRIGNYVTFHGRKKYDELPPFFDSCNVGVSYVPIKDYYQHQPVTKTFEFILSGLYCIATETEANKAVVSLENGYLIKDDAGHFASALEYIYLNRDGFDSERIMNSLKEYLWPNLIEKYFIPILERR